MKKLIFVLMTSFLIACSHQESQTPSIQDFKYSVDRFADIEILRYRVLDFEELSLQQKN